MLTSKDLPFATLSQSSTSGDDIAALIGMVKSQSETMDSALALLGKYESQLGNLRKEYRDLKSTNDGKSQAASDDEASDEERKSSARSRSTDRFQSKRRKRSHHNKNGKQGGSSQDHNQKGKPAKPSLQQLRKAHAATAATLKDVIARRAQLDAGGQN